MPRNSTEHLGLEELEQLESVRGEMEGESLREVHRHLDTCARCRRTQQTFRELNARLGKSQSREQLPRPAGCPEEFLWLKISLGMLSQEAEQENLSHAARCDHCGPLLKQAWMDLNSDLSMEEEEIISQLPSASPSGERALAEKIAGSSRLAKESPVRGRLWPSWLPQFTMAPRWVLAVAAGVILAAVVSVMQFRKNPSTEELLATAYTTQRTIELRIPGAAYGALRVQRGFQPSQLSKPTALLDAEARISRELSTGKQTARVLEEKGTAELLNGEPEAAIGSLQQALALDSTSARIRIMLAVALSERAGPECKNHPRDCADAIQYLGEALAANPNATAALYNRAILEERLTLFSNAARDWEHLIAIEPDQAWSQDARERMEQLKKRLEEHRSRIDSQLLQLSKLSTAVLSPAARNSIDARIEEYLDLALREWLPQVQGSFADDDSFRSGLDALGSILALRHHDFWLADAMASASSQKLQNAFSLLSQALHAESHGDPAQALALARKAERVFQAQDYRPGALRAQLETVYALHRLALGQQCLAKARPLLSSIQSTIIPGSKLNFCWSCSVAIP